MKANNSNGNNLAKEIKNLKVEDKQNNIPFQAKKLDSSVTQKSNDVYQQQIDELKSEIVQNNSLLNKIESLLEKKYQNPDQKNAPTNIHNAVPRLNKNSNNNGFVPTNNDFPVVNSNVFANQIQMPNNILNANANLVNNPYLLMSNNNINGFQPNFNLNALQMNGNPLGIMMNNNNFAAAVAYQNPYIANTNNFNPALNNQFLGFNRM